MTPLKALILLTLRKSGPLSDLDLLQLLPDELTGDMSATIVIVCFELQREGYIEPPPNDPHIWQLSVKGMDYVATQLQSDKRQEGHSWIIVRSRKSRKSFTQV